MITDHAGILSRWAEHFNSVLNQVSQFDDTVLSEIPDWEVHDGLVEPPDNAEVARAVGQLARQQGQTDSHQSCLR